jgi:hypothetical protein
MVHIGMLRNDPLTEEEETEGLRSIREITKLWHQSAVAPTIEETCSLTLTHLQMENFQRDHLFRGSSRQTLSANRANHLLWEYQNRAEPNHLALEGRRSPGRISAAKFASWYGSWIAKCNAANVIPSRDQDLEAAKCAFNNAKIPRSLLRDNRSILAPPAWKARGRRKSASKEDPAS